MFPLDSHYPLRESLGPLDACLKPRVPAPRGSKVGADYSRSNRSIGTTKTVAPPTCTLTG
jgi:hypothetical protein